MRNLRSFPSYPALKKERMAPYYWPMSFLSLNLFALKNNKMFYQFIPKQPFELFTTILQIINSRVLRILGLEWLM